ncbi:HAD-superfamily hydrolase subfamily IB, PSPase-like:HAD-superfamily subfamily IB, PSPase-like [Thermobifida fusca YX]|jgi:HAD superfamily hydrolase (TIGR01490 family)|nr:HAD-IB family hydrolase [Thermobifida fusca]AAZ56755.1 HAD-superfamily hydrolase subfamily IB, PSPase-like:HAD-superfamily subfamily IB, PSPase-like [Thermobifida fusca YX]MDD6792088.1 HAD-IB family hydrolase [Thermobifida fusca]
MTDSSGISGRRLSSMWSRLRDRGPSRTAFTGAASVTASTRLSSPVPRSPSFDRTAAFFDVDNTLMRGASLYYFARGLAARKLFTTRDLIRFGWGQLVFRFSGAEQRHHINEACETALAFVAGRKVSDLVALCEEIYDETVADRIWEGARRLVYRHLNAGQRVWLVTATPVELADIIKRRLGLTGALGTVAESVNGVYTGRLVGDLLHGAAKAEAVRKLAKLEGLDLAQCTAYSDSYNDLPLLSLVGHPNAVNPDDALHRHAQAHGWPVHDFRRHRTALTVGLPSAMAGALAGGALVGLLRNRRRG